MNTNASASDLEGLVSVIALIACVSVVLPFQAAVLPVFAMCATAVAVPGPGPPGPGPLRLSAPSQPVSRRHVASPFKGERASFLRLSTKPL